MSFGLLASLSWPKWVLLVLFTCVFSWLFFFLCLSSFCLISMASHPSLAPLLIAEAVHIHTHTDACALYSCAAQAQCVPTSCVLFILQCTIAHSSLLSTCTVLLFVLVCKHSGDRYWVWWWWWRRRRSRNWVSEGGKTTAEENVVIAWGGGQSAEPARNAHWSVYPNYEGQGCLPLTLSADATTLLLGSCEPRDICAGVSNTICNNMVGGGGGTLQDNSTVAHAAVRSLITQSLPETRQICAVTEKTVCTVYKFRTREYGNHRCIFFCIRSFTFVENSELQTHTWISCGQPSWWFWFYTNNRLLELNINK